MDKFDFNRVKNSPAVNAAEQEILNGFDELNHGISNADNSGGRIANAPEQSQPYTVFPKSEPPVPPVKSEQHDIPAAVAIAQPGEPMQNINVPIPISLHSRLKIMAAQQRINMKDLVALAIKEYVEKQS